MAQIVVPLHGYRQDDIPWPSEGAVAAEPAKPAPAAVSPEDLERIMARLNAAAARAARELPPAPLRYRQLVIAAAFALSALSGVVTAHYLIPGHARPGAALHTAR